MTYCAVHCLNHHACFITFHACIARCVNTVYAGDSFATCLAILPWNPYLTLTTDPFQTARKLERWGLGSALGRGLKAGRHGGGTGARWKSGASAHKLAAAAELGCWPPAGEGGDSGFKTVRHPLKQTRRVRADGEGLQINPNRSISCLTQGPCSIIILLHHVPRDRCILNV